MKEYEHRTITSSYIGRIRTKIKEQIISELDELDDLILDLFKEISSSVSKKTLEKFFTPD